MTPISISFVLFSQKHTTTEKHNISQTKHAFLYVADIKDNECSSLSDFRLDNEKYYRCHYTYININQSIIFLTWPKQQTATFKDDKGKKQLKGKTRVEVTAKVHL